MSNNLPEDQIDSDSSWYGLDTENDENGNVTLVALVGENGEAYVWKSAGHFKRWCQKQSTSTIVVAHNLEYDLINEFGDYYPYLWLNYLKGRLISARFGNVSFYDSFNHFRMNLADLGESIGISKREMNIYDEDYVKTDAWIALRAMIMARDFIASLGGRMGATSGASAISIWRHLTDDEYCVGPIDTPWLRRGYYGGRTEIFRKLAIGDVRGYDVNSMYPYCMMNEFPISLSDDPGLVKSKGMAEVIIQVPHDLFVAPLPYRTRDKSLVYPVGKLEGVWSYDELRWAEHLGAKIQKVKQAYGGNDLVRPFDDFVTTLYRQRERSNSKHEQLFLKILLNNLYGKLASRNTVTRCVSRHILLRNKQFKRLGQVTWINEHRGLLDYFVPQAPYVNVCWGSMITAYARIVLGRYLCAVPWDKLIYADTDSCYCLDYEIQTGAGLGQVKLEKRCRRMYVPQPKAYQLVGWDGEVQSIAKGVPRPRMTQNGIVVDFAKEYIENGTTQFMAPMRFRKSIQTNVKANKWVMETKSLKTQYTQKRFSNGHYFPPVVGEQLEFDFSVALLKSKRGTIRSNERAERISNNNPNNQP
jgi:hypothetical protein